MIHPLSQHRSKYSFQSFHDLPLPDTLGASSSDPLSTCSPDPHCTIKWLFLSRDVLSSQLWGNMFLLHSSLALSSNTRKTSKSELEPQCPLNIHHKLLCNLKSSTYYQHCLY